MGASFQWREPRDVEARSLSKNIAFGGHRDGGTGYLAFSERVGPCVLVLHEFFGLQPFFKHYADALRDEGFTVLVPDLYDGVVAERLEEAEAVASALDEERTLRRLRASVDYLTANWHPRLGAVGFSLGARFACALAQEGLLEATVLYYCLGEVRPEQWRGPLLGHFADKDDWVSRSEVQDVIAGLEGHDIDAEVYVYSDTGHWFANSSSPAAYRPVAADLARHRTIEFLRYHLA